MGAGVISAKCIVMNEQGERSIDQNLPARRRKARHYAMQALYQWHMAGSSLTDIEAYFEAEHDLSKADKSYFSELLHEVPVRLNELEELFSSHLDRDISEIGPVERALLRMSTYELVARIDVPYKVVINESVALAKKFGAQDSHKFINSILDKVAQSVRAVEIANR